MFPLLVLPVRCLELEGELNFAPTADMSRRIKEKFEKS